MLALKLPLAALIYIVWWAIKQEPEDSASDDDGGIKRQHRPHPPKPFPRRPRRGPHGDPAPDAARPRAHDASSRAHARPLKFAGVSLATLRRKGHRCGGFF